MNIDVSSHGLLKLVLAIYEIAINKFMKRIVLLMLTMGFGNCDKTKQVLAERNNPTDFLSCMGKAWNNESDYIEGTLTNSALKTDYGNIVMIIEFYDVKGAKIGTERIVEFEILKHGQSRTYKHNIHPPNLVDNLKVVIDRAQFIDTVETER